MTRAASGYKLTNMRLILVKIVLILSLLDRLTMHEKDLIDVFSLIEKLRCVRKVPDEGVLCPGGALCPPYKTGRLNSGARPGTLL